MYAAPPLVAVLSSQLVSLHITCGVGTNRAEDGCMACNVKQHRLLHGFPAQHQLLCKFASLHIHTAFQNLMFFT
jgi:hypothetical protein